MRFLPFSLILLLTACATTPGPVAPVAAPPPPGLGRLIGIDAAAVIARRCGRPRQPAWHASFDYFGAVPERGECFAAALNVGFEAAQQ